MTNVPCDWPNLLDTLVNCHFAGGAYVVVNFHCTVGVGTQFQPPYAQLTITPGKNAKVIYNKFKSNLSVKFTTDSSRYWIFWDPGGQEILVWHDFLGNIDDLGPSPYGWGDVNSMLAAGGATAANDYTFTVNPPFNGLSSSPGYEINQTINNPYQSGDTRADAIQVVNNNNANLGPILPPFPGTSAYRFSINWGVIPIFESESRATWEALIQITGPSNSPAFTIGAAGMGSDASNGSIASINVQIWDAQQFGNKQITDSSQLTAQDDDRMADSGQPALPSSSYAVTCLLPTPVNPSREFGITHPGPVWLLKSSMQFHENP